MKKKEPEIIFNVHEDSELEALAKAYVQAANTRKMTLTQANKVLAQIWREDITEPKAAEKLIKMPLEETEEQKIFRRKAEGLVDQYPEFVCRHGLTNNSEYRQYTIEVICAIHKMFLEKDRIQNSMLLYYIRDYFKQVSENPAYSNTTTIDYCKKHIFSTMNKLEFNTTKYSNVGCLRCVDMSYRPTVYKQKPDIDSSFRTIDYLVEPYLKEKEYDIRRSKTSTAVVQLIWLVETFF